MAALLRHYLSAASQRGFVWGEHDCILFAAGWVRQVSGEDPAANWRGHYASEEQAKAILADLGGIGACMELALLANGWRPVSVVALEPGDIVLAALGDGRSEVAAGIAASSRKIAFVTARPRPQAKARPGLVIARVPVLKAWRHG